MIQSHGQHNTGKPVYLNVTPWAQPATKGEVWLHRALRNADTVQDSYVWQHSLDKRWEIFDKVGVGEGVEFRDFNRAYKMHQNVVPHVPYQWMEGWMGPNPVIEVVKPHADNGVIQSLGGVHFNSDNWFGYKTDVEVHCSPRAVGKFLSMAETTRQYYLNFVNSEEGRSLVAALEEHSHGHNVPIKYVSGGFLKKSGEGTTMAAINLQHGNLFTHPGLYSIAEQYGRELGISPDEFVKYIMAHEIAHTYLTFHNKGDVFDIETEIDQFLADFYAERAAHFPKGYTPAVFGSESNKGVDSKAKAAHAAKRVKDVEENYGQKGKQKNNHHSLEEIVEEAKEDTERLEEFVESDYVSHDGDESENYETREDESGNYDAEMSDSYEASDTSPESN